MNPAAQRFAVLALIVAALVAADQYTKGLIESSLPLGGGFNVIPGFFDIVHIRNTGAAFGLLSGVDSEWVSRGFMLFTVVALGALAAMYRSLPAGERLSRTALVMIGSGAIGNFIDRVERGGVTDYLLFYIGEYRWPAFNVADSLITVGVIALVVTIIFPRRPGGPA